MAQEGVVRRRAAAGGAVLALTAGMAFVMGGATAAAASSVTTVAGVAYGYHAYSMSFFGGLQKDTGPTPIATLAPNASNSPQTSTSSTGLVQYGPATLFTSDGISATTSGSLGTTGSVTSHTSVADINKASTQPLNTGSEQLTADNISSRCSASTSGASGGTTVTNGTVEVNNGSTPKFVTVPTSPAPNTAIKGVIHISASDKESFRFVFNEQVKSGNSIIVNAVHEYLNGPTAKGNLIIGQAVCSTAGTDVSVQNPGITHTPDPVPAGGTVTFTVTVTNLGPNVAPVVADASAVMGGGKISSATPSAGTCGSASLQSTLVSCKLGSIASGSSATVRIVVLAPNSSGGSVAISSAVTSPADDNPSNNIATDSVGVS